MLKTLLLLHAAVTFFLVGLIWTIQIVHYPLFAQVGPDGYIDYHNAHQWRITLVVLPTMIFELASAALLVWLRPAPVPAWMALAGFALVIVIWASTFFLQVPQHTALGSGFDVEAHRLLVGGNWIRTIAWSLRGALVLGMLARLI